MITTLISKELKAEEIKLRSKFNQAIKKVQELEIDAEEIVAKLRAEFLNKWNELVTKHSTATVQGKPLPSGEVDTDLNNF